MSKPLTADTITDAQIRELRGRACDVGDTNTWRLCDLALGAEDPRFRECPVCGEGQDQPCRSTKRRAFKHQWNARSPLMKRDHPSRVVSRDEARARIADHINQRAKRAGKDTP